MKRVIEYGAIFMLSGFLILKGIIPAWNTVHSDFANYYVSSRLVLERAPLDSLYSNAWFQDQITEHGIDVNGKFAPFPPATAWILLPLAPLSPLNAQRIWTCVNLALLSLCVLLVKRITGWSLARCSLLLLAGGLSLTNNIAFGQMYILLLAAMLAAYVAELNGRTFLAGSLLGFFTVVKYFPASTLIGFLISRRRAPVVYSLIVFAVLILVQWAAFGTGVMVEFAGSVFLPHLNGDLGSQGPFTFNFQSWDGFLTFLFVKDSVYNPTPLFDWPLGKIIFKLIVYGLFLLSAIVLLAKINTYPDEKRLPVNLAIISLLAMVLLPASATYHFILLVFPLVLLLAAGVLRAREKIVMIVLYAIIGFIPYGLTFRLGHTYGLVFGFPRLWLVSLLYASIFLSLYRSPGPAPEKEIT